MRLNVRPSLLTAAAVLLAFLPSVVVGGALSSRTGSGALVRRAKQARERAARYVKQDEVVRFPRLGAVRVQAVEVPGRLPRLDFTSLTTGRRLLVVAVGRSDPSAFV